MSWISIACFGGFFLLLASLFKKGTDIFAPARIFLLVWTLAIGLAELKLSRFQFEWSSWSWMILLLTLFSFLIGVFVIYVVNSDKKLIPIKITREYFKSLKIDSHYLYKSINLLFVLYIISYIASFIIIGYLPIFASRPEIRSQWGIFGFGLLTHLPPTLLYLSTLFLFFNRNDIEKKIIIIFISVVTFATHLFLLHRFDFFLWIILTIVFLYYASDKIKTRYVLFFIIFVIGLMYGISLFRTSKFIADVIYYLGDMKYSVKYAIFTEPYMYFAMNLENFSNGVDKLKVFDYGVHTFDFLLALTGLKYPLAEYLKVKEFPHMITNNFNTYTMFYIYYRDFGVVGITLLPFILGSIVSSFYYSMRKFPSIFSISIYGLLLFVILLSFFVNMLAWLHFVFNLVLIAFLTKYLICKN
jgi:oligosaccharide repeat unit polymerase